VSDQRNPLTVRYLEQLAAALERTLMPQDERDAISREMESHLAEAVSSGARLTDVLERLGSAEDLARAYAVELALNPRPVHQASPWRQVLAVATRTSATLAAGLLVVVMGAVGVAFAVGGVAALLVGLIAPFLPVDWMDPTLRAGLPQLVVVLAGLALLAVGILSIRIVRLNARFLFGALRRDSKEISK